MPSSSTQEAEVAWDLFDRCLLPVLFAHAVSVILSYITPISSIGLFLLLGSATLAAVLAYHNLKVSAAGKVVLITGCETRIGQALVRHLDSEGFTIIAGVQDAEAEDAKKLMEETSARVHVEIFDVTDENKRKTFIAHAHSHASNGIWALVNLASVAAIGQLEWFPAETLERVLQVNVVANMRLIQALLPSLRQNKGRVINVTSILGRIPKPMRGAQCCAYSALHAVTECMRLELQPWGVDMVLVEPGDYTTGNIWLDQEKLLKQARSLWLAMTPEVRETYGGEDLFERQVRSLEKYTKGPDADITVALKSLSDAVARTFPLTRYTPVTRAEKIHVWVAEHLPVSVYQALYE